MFKRLLPMLIVIALAASLFLVQSASAQGTTHVVQPGDNLFRIAIRYGTTVQAIQTANGLTGFTIFVGQTLIIPSGATVITSTAASTDSTVTPTPAPTSPGTYVVQLNDTVYRIALKFGTTVNAIASANRLTNFRIFVGQTLIIPDASGNITSPAATALPATPAPGDSNVPALNLTAGSTYTVRAGDTLFRIAINAGTTVSALMTANGLRSFTIFVGQKLIIPGASETTTAPTATPTPAGTVTVTATPPPGATSTPTRVATTTSSTTFELGGQVAGFGFPDLMKQTGMTWVKRQVTWSPGDSASGQSGIISDAKSKGFKILLSVKGGPDNSTSDKFSAFASYLGDLAALNTDAIEVWNEMNLDREWKSGQISASSYTSMLQQSYNAIKAKNPNTMVISGALSPTGYFGGCSGIGCDDKPYLESMVAAGALNYMDCLGIHYNEGFGAKKLCFTELGYLSGQEWGYVPAGFLWKPPYNLTVAEQAQFMADAVKISKAQGKTRLFIIFNVDFTVWTDDPQAGYAILRPNNTCPTCDSVKTAMGN
ncbi:MAG: LysM peptidoglycan-binding domain-containing protein [Chloroflexi bacterium]|nr:LysM peptidoglycan-binding domain-containing protein [Chloroflexota bacterium]